MDKAQTFLFYLCFTWTLFAGTAANFQLYNRDAIGQQGNRPRNISVHINGPNGGNICIDCQNQIQVDNGLEPNMPPAVPPFYFLPNQLSGNFLRSFANVPVPMDPQNLAYNLRPPPSILELGPQTESVLVMQLSLNSIPNPTPRPPESKLVRVGFVPVPSFRSGKEVQDSVEDDKSE